MEYLFCEILTCILDYNHRSSWWVYQRICVHIGGFPPWHIRRRYSEAVHPIHLYSRLLYYTQVDNRCIGHCCTWIVRLRKCCSLSLRNPLHHSYRHNLREKHTTNINFNLNNFNFNFKYAQQKFNACIYHPLHRSDIVNEYIWSFDMWIPEANMFCIENCRICLRHYIQMKIKT